MTLLPRVQFTFPECPGWCPVDHDDAYDLEMGSRIHEELVWGREDEKSPGYLRAYVRLGSCDTVDGYHEPLELVVYSKDDPLDPAEAREFAAAIVKAVDLYEKWSTPAGSQQTGESV